MTSYFLPLILQSLGCKLQHQTGHSYVQQLIPNQNQHCLISLKEEPQSIDWVRVDIDPLKLVPDKILKDVPDGRQVLYPFGPVHVCRLLSDLSWSWNQRITGMAGRTEGLFPGPGICWWWWFLAWIRTLMRWSW